MYVYGTVSLFKAHHTFFAAYGFVEYEDRRDAEVHLFTPLVVYFNLWFIDMLVLFIYFCGPVFNL